MNEENDVTYQVCWHRAVLSAWIHREADKIEKNFGSCPESAALRRVAHVVREASIGLPPEDWRINAPVPNSMFDSQD